MKFGQKKKVQISTEDLSTCNMLFVFAFLAVNYLGVLKRRNPLKEKINYMNTVLWKGSKHGAPVHGLPQKHYISIEYY